MSTLPSLLPSLLPSAGIVGKGGQGLTPYQASIVDQGVPIGNSGKYIPLDDLLYSLNMTTNKNNPTRNYLVKDSKVNTAIDQEFGKNYGYNTSNDGSSGSTLLIIAFVFMFIVVLLKR